MNNTRRKQLKAILEKLEDLKAELENVKYDEDDARDNIPESLWGTERYEKAEEACDNLEEAVSNLEEALEYIETAME